MKIKNLILILGLSLSSFVNVKGNSNPLTGKAPSQIVSHYIDAVAKGETELLDHLFAEDFQFRSNEKRNKGDKTALTKFLKSLKGCVLTDCHTSFDILDTNKGVCITKVKFNFQDFVRVDYVTLHYSADGWQIHNLFSCINDL